MKRIFVLLLLVVLTSGSVWGATINVPDDHATIQAAIDAAVDGDTIFVAPGTYVENIDFKQKSLILSSTFQKNRDSQMISSTVIDGDDYGPLVEEDGTWGYEDDGTWTALSSDDFVSGVVSFRPAGFSLSIPLLR